MIEIPDEFKDLNVSDVKPEEYHRRVKRKKLIRTATNRNLDNYDVWRCHDR